MSGTTRARFRPLPSATIVAMVTALALTLAAVPGLAIEPAPEDLPQDPRVDITPQVVDLTFPVAEPGNGVTFIDDFLYLRGGGSRLHAATDLMAPKHRPIHAAVSGTVIWAPATEPNYGWMLSIKGDDGRRYAYVHLNNDTPVQDADGRWLDDDDGGIEHAYGPRIVEAIQATGSAKGLQVSRGELIGYVGDSGNAKGVTPHLHFEMHMTDAEGEYRINPYHSLVAALEGGDVPGATTVESDRLFQDVEPTGAHAGAIERLAEASIVRGCSATLYCPSTAVTRGDLAAYLAAALQLDTSGPPRFTDVASDDPNGGAIAAVDEARIMQGYGDDLFGPNDPLSRAQLASMLVSGFQLPAASGDIPFTDVSETSVHAANIVAAHAAGLTKGCDDGTRYCGSLPVTRGQIASFLESGLATL